MTSRITGGDKLKAHLRQQQVMPTPPVIQVGFFGDTLVHGEKANELAAALEFGFKSGNAVVPERRFMLKAQRTSQAVVQRALTVIYRRGHGIDRASAEEIGHLIEQEIQRAMRQGDYAPNRPSRLLTKRGTTPLIDTGDLANAVRVHVVEIPGVGGA